jgi:F-type H+-transporting ATPase subunit delta
MPQGASARRYAEAAFDLAKKQGKLDRWLSDLRVAAGVLADPRLQRILTDPKVSRLKKREILDGAFTVSVDPMVHNLLYLLADRGRLHQIGRIVDQFVELYNKDQGIVVANVTTAVPLDADQQKKLQDRLKDLTGAKQIDLRAQSDPRIIGGLIARVGDVLYDGSVRTKLAELQERLS